MLARSYRSRSILTNKFEASARLSKLISLAWRTFDKASILPGCVAPAIPILFFGDLAKYQTSPLRIVTVGLNPSFHEFPADDPFQRFPQFHNQNHRNTDRYIESMSSYFLVEPYKTWFNSLDSILDGAGASYYPNLEATTALHTDICSPVATNPTWCHLSKSDKDVLEKDGSQLWRALLDELRPQIVFVSVARTHLERNGFGLLTDWEVIFKFENKADGTPRKSAYEIRSRWFEIGGQHTLFVFGHAAQLPFGTLARPFKQETGKAALRAFHRGDRVHG